MSIEKRDIMRISNFCCASQKGDVARVMGWLRDFGRLSDGFAAGLVRLLDG